MSNISFYLSPFERYIILCYLSEVLGEIDSYKSGEGIIEGFEEIITDEKYKTLNYKAISRVKEILNDVNLPLLKLFLLELEKEEKPKERNYETLNEEEKYYCELIHKKIQNIIELFKVTSEFKLELEIGYRNGRSELLFKSNNLLNKSLFNLQKNIIIYNKLNTELLSDIIRIPVIIQFIDPLISHLVAKLIFEELFKESGHEGYEVKLLETVFKETVVPFKLNFFSKFFLNEETRKGLKKVVDDIPEQEVYKVESIRKERLGHPYYFFEQNRLGQLAKKLREESPHSHIRTFGFGFAEYIKVCREGQHLYVEEDIKKCEEHNKDLSEYDKGVFLIHKDCYNIFKYEDEAGRVFEQYVYLTIREKIARKLLNFIVSRNIQFFTLKDQKSADGNPIEFDIICIPAGDLFNKILIIECKLTCDNNDVSRFKKNIKEVFGEGSAKYIYPTIVFLNSKVENEAQEKSSDVILYSVNEIERLIEDYVKTSIQ